MTFFRTTGYALLDRKKNEENLEDLKLEPFDEKPIGYKSNLLRRVKKPTTTG
jgi:hypothetical protein